MAKEVSLKITYLQAPGVRKPTAEKLHQDVKDAGYGFFRENPEYAPSFLLFASGIKSEQLTEEIKKAPEKGVSPESVILLEDANQKLKTFEDENLELFNDLSETYQEASPQIEIVEFQEAPEYISFKPNSDNSSYELTSTSSFGKLEVGVGPAKEAASFALNKVLEPVKKKVVETGIKAATKAATKAAVGTATKVGVQAAAQAAGTTVPVIGNIVAFILTTFVTGIIDRALIAAKKRAKDVEDAVGGAILSFIQFLGLIGGALGATFSTMMGIAIIVIISIPFAVAYILFVINSGAYIVPPSDILAPGENPYIEITKVASQTDFKNPDLPITVSYTITVTPLRGSLTNITFSHECEILSRRPTDGCPAPLPSPLPVLISPTEPYVYTYAVTYTQSDADYRDSLVLNTFSVTADTDEVSQTTATGAASVIIGNPPTECYTFDGSWDAGSQAQGYKNMLLGAITTLTSNYTPFAQKVCTGGQPVRLEYTQSLGCPGAWACAFRNGVIRFNGGGLNNSNSALYILTHESGHIVNYRLDSLYQQYEDWPGVDQERPSICSYAPARTWASEAFAESAALYVASTRCTTPSTYPSLYPAHYSFADQVLF